MPKAPHIFFVFAIFLRLLSVIVGRTIDGKAAASIKGSSECRGEVGEILQQVRALMNDTSKLDRSPIHAYIVPMNDAHMSEYIADHDKRLQYISKFTGSAGHALVTAEHAVLWTDYRYHLQADEQLDAECWTLMKSGLTNVSSITEWMIENLPKNSTVGVDPFLMTDLTFRQYGEVLKTNDMELVSISNNLIDIVWKNRPAAKNDPIIPLAIKYSGKEAGLKITEVLSKIKEEYAAETIVITTLDDIAWLLNLRGSDIVYNPIFFSYVILSPGNSYFFVDKSKITEETAKHLSTEHVNLIVRNYDEILDGIKDIVNATQTKIVTSTDVSHAIAKIIPVDKRVARNVVAAMKAVKNPIEAKNMENAHIRDGLALIQYLHWLNSTIDSENVTELSGALRLAQYRAQQDNFRGLSFETISAVGKHAAMPHYSPTEETALQITRDQVYLVDSGGQYWDGTTDITRTVHFGIPKEEEKECYTRVLKGYIALAITVFPVNTTINFLDYTARRALWQVGLNYGHGTGHGVGMYLLVHEYPPSIGSATEILYENMFHSDEPGYYKADHFGIRIEDVIQVIKSDIENAFDGKGALTFKSITYAPLFTNLIVTDMLTKEEANYVNTYNKRVMDTIGPILLKHKHMDTYKWLQKETRQICSWSK